jgi:cold shock CspA family protein
LYNDRRGFGFITSTSPEQSKSNHIFFHISEVRPRVQDPRVGDLVEFSLSSDREGRLCAKQVRMLTPPGNECNESAGDGLARYLGEDEAA